jgi:hypothetical protein
VTGLKREIELALMDEFHGDAFSPALAGRLKMVVRAVLLRHGLAKAQIQIGKQGSGVEVAITLPPGPNRVRRLVLNLG